MKIGYLIAGLLILANPNIGIIDFLPDFFGYLLIIHALRTSAVIIPYWSDTVKGAAKMLAVSSVKLFCVPLIFKDIDSLPILLSFSFALIELIFLLPTVNKLFEGLFYAGMRYDIPSVFSHQVNSRSDERLEDKKGTQKNRELGTKVKRLTIAFLIFRAVVSILPNLSDLQLFEHSGEVTDGYVIRFSDFNNLFVLIAFIVGIVGSIIWISSFIPYFLRISKDVSQCSLTNICKGLENSPEFADRLAMRRELIFLILSVATAVFIPIDGINYLMGVIPAVFLIIPAVFHRKYNRNAGFLLIPAIVCAVTSCFEFFKRYKFFAEFDYEPEAALWIPNAKKIYSGVVLYSLLDRLFLLITLLIAFRLICKKWNDDFMKLMNSESPDIYAKECHASLRKRFKVFAILSIPLFILTAFEPYLILQIDFISVLLTLLSIVWALFGVIILLDMMKDSYTLKVDCNDVNISVKENDQ